MRPLLDLGGKAGAVVVYPVAVILGVLVAYAWWLVLVGVVLPVFATVVGAD